MSLVDSKQKRVTFSKKKRLEILEKTNGRCGYCGEALEKFCIDHIIPLANSIGTNDESNLIAACFQCNSFKMIHSLKQFRHELSQQVDRLKKYSVNGRMAIKFGLIQETNKPVEFYFETLNKEG